MDQQQLLNERYGVKPPASKRRLVIAAAALLTAFFAWAIWVSFFSPAKATPTTTGYVVESATSTKVKFKVQKPSGVEAVCAAKVLNQSYAIVGYREVVVPASADATTVVETRVNTTSEGVTGLVEECWLR